MGLILIPFLAYLFILVSLCVSLILYVLLNIRKVGFLKTVKSKTAVSIIVWMAICGGLPALLFIWSSIPRSGDQLFKDFILDPMPKSVKVLDSYDGSPNFDPDDCLHFTISSDDFKLILASKNWKVVSEQPDGVECLPAVFPPPSLGSNLMIYSYIPGERDREVMVTNSQTSEVYYYYFDGNLP